ncbi:MAG: Nif11-like leader peptide family RiPP precursor [Oscillospiraceae bacterium]|nr:Nif11-like leader peptide family RiPP precursor [Oscillospiraceae bacterium]
MNENVKSFLEEAAKDEALAERLAGAETAEELLALAAEKGYALKEEDLASALAAPKTGELDDADLDDVTGGVGLRNLSIGNIGRSISKLLRLFDPKFKTLEYDSEEDENPIASTLEHNSFGTPLARTLENRNTIAQPTAQKTIRL